MKLVCKRNAFQKDGNPRDDDPLTLPLTVGKSYHVQSMTLLDRDTGGLFDLNALQNEKYVLVVFSDNGFWQEIEVPQDYIPEDCAHMDFLNQQFRSVFEDPT